MVTVAISCYRGPTYRGAKSGGGLVTLFDSYYDDGVIAAFGVQHTSPKSGGGLVTLFYSWMPLSLMNHDESLCLNQAEMCDC